MEILLHFVEEFLNDRNSLLLEVIPFLLSFFMPFVNMLLEFIPLLLSSLRSLFSLFLVLCLPDFAFLVPLVKFFSD
jgi:hypothetical protein